METLVLFFWKNSTIIIAGIVTKNHLKIKNPLQNGTGY